MDISPLESPATPPELDGFSGFSVLGLEVPFVSFSVCF